jgi:hypothetical protein
MRAKLDLVVTGGDEEIRELLILLRKIQWCGRTGCSRKIPVFVDGDGSARLSFYVNNQEFNPDWIDTCKDIKEIVSLDMEKMKKVGEGDDFELQCIGE